jgi:hypothetical protein
VLTIKILGLGIPERYAVRRMVAAAQNELQLVDPQVQMTVSEIDDAGQIGRYASFLVLPTLVINEKVVCSGRFPTREEITGWMIEARNNG